MGFIFQYLDFLVHEDSVSMIERLTRMPCVREVWSSNLGQVKSYNRIINGSPTLQHLRLEACVFYQALFEEWEPSISK